MFTRILIANRGEIACRVISTARRMGISTVAVYSDADREALHVRMAEQAIHIGESPAALSYLDAERILQAAVETGAEAIHPGYGFLSENADFARRCEAAGIVFIGPTADAIESMGSKSQAKSIMQEAAVPLIPGYHGDDQSDIVLRQHAERMGYPVLLKATAGGGGKGMRAVHGEKEFDDALAAARRESKASFGDDRMLVEKLLLEPRHVEVQVFCDSQGNGVYLSERDCSIQRRHQKVIEEAPAPGLSDELRQTLGETAVQAARAIDYRGAGTVEFLLDREHRFYFMEMNTRLQVEHPVTELVTGLDLVDWQIRIAAGEALPLAQEEICISGHAMEARIYAEDPSLDFVPSTGVINFLRTPKTHTHVRIDTGVTEGSAISPYYDPMIAKLIVLGADREEARQRLAVALGEFKVAGVSNNISYLKRIVELPAFAEEKLNTHFIEDHQEALCTTGETTLARNLAAAALVLREHRRANAGPGNDRHSPWNDHHAWRVSSAAKQRFCILNGDREQELELRQSRAGMTLQFGEQLFKVQGGVHGETLELEIDGIVHRASLALATQEQDAVHTLFFADGEFAFHEKTTEFGADVAAAGDASFAAPMHGSVVALLVDPNTEVQAGDAVIVIEAMKMEQTLRAPCAGTVEAYKCAPGDLVDRGQEMVAFTPGNRD